MACSETSTASTEPFLLLDAANDTVNYAATQSNGALSSHNKLPDRVSHVSFDLNEAPPPYSCEPNWKLTYVDFTPKCLIAGGILTSPTFETFNVLVAKANNYLLRHPNTCVKCMETTRFTVKDINKAGVVVDTRVPTLAESSATGFLVHGLRMWIMPKEEDTAAQVGYLNVVPACLDPGGILRKPKFDTLANTVKKLNALLDKTPLPGRVLNIETVSLLFRQHSNWIEPDRCHWRRYNDISSSHIYFLRLYYEACDAPHATHIGYKDFVPMAMSKSHRMLHPTEKFESVHDLSHHASVWLQKQHDLHVLNIETTYYKVHKGKRTRAQTEESLSIQYGSSQQLQCLRVWHTAQHEDAHSTSFSDSHVSIQCRMFCPEQMVEGGMFSSPVFESMIDTRQRLKDWALTYQETPMISAESVHVKLHSGLPEEMWSAITHHRGNLDYHAMYITVLRVYVFMQKGSGANDGVFPHINNGLILDDEHLAEDDNLSTELNTAV